MEYERLSFPEAVERLAHRLGLEVPSARNDEDDGRKQRRLQEAQLEEAKISTSNNYAIIPIELEPLTISRVEASPGK